MREPKESTSRADIVIITKCPKDLKPMEFRVLKRALNLYPYQELYFTTLRYNALKALFSDERLSLNALPKNVNIMLLTGIASPQQMIVDLQAVSRHITPLTFSDHHQFTPTDIERINNTFAALPEPKIIITTEKDATRLTHATGLADSTKENIYALPIRIQFMLGGEEEFNNKIISYVRKNSRNSILVKRKNDHKA